MSENLHKDEFEDFFKDTFENQSELADDQGWDLPSEKVWENVDNVINPEEDPERGILWFRSLGPWLLLGLMMITGLAVFHVFKNNEKEKPLVEESREIVLDNEANQSSKKDLKKETKLDSEKGEEKENSEVVSTSSNLENNSNNNSEIKTTLENSKYDIAPEKIENQLSSQNIKSKPAENSNSGISSNSNKSSTPQNNSELENNSLGGVIVDNDDEGKKTSDDKNEPQGEANQIEKNPSLITKERPFLALQSIPVLPSYAEVQNNSEDTLAKITPFTDFNDPIDLPEAVNKGFYIGGMFAPMSNYRTVQAKGRTPVPARLINDETPNLTFSAGVNLGYKLSDNWSVETGLNFSKLSIQHDRLRQIRYSVVGEQMNTPGEFQRDYSLNLSSSGGTVDTDIALARESGTSIPENDFIAIRLETQHNISFVNVPLVARYQFGNKKIQIGLKAGFVNRFITKGEFQFESAEVLRTGLRLVLNDRFYEPRKLQSLKSYEMDFLVGAGVYYHFTDKLWLSVEPTVTRSLNPIFENQNFKTYPVFRSLDVGVNYSF